MSGSALFAVKLQLQLQTNGFVFSPSYQVAEQQISKRFVSASLAKETLVPLNASRQSDRGEDWGINGRVSCPFLSLWYVWDIWGKPC